ncbi:hypothetical protein P6U16_08670 [Rhizobium sp. 32-5/1]|uniref:hypothetical protein n=1 Tax=Rhizobium sp. 32-5/1 TaxID=3019602 RepID=UPI00240D50A2|nr:hypothetical protein [Rhizobium sp. 32-5/1]WEZ84628.1 hypothetical protein P6U16_08670 [Rhizobium sp. 32-5/1]
MFNRSEIMKGAWTHFRKAQAYVAGNPFLAGTVVRFGDCLKVEWRRAKEALVKAQLPAAIAARVAALRSTIQTLDYKSFRYSIARERSALSAELRAIEREYA